METIQAPNGSAHHSTSELIKDIIADVQEIIRSEVRLAKAELKEEGAKAGIAGGMFGAAAMLGFFGLALFEGMCVVLWAILTPLWIAFLIMGVISLVAGGIFYAAGLDKWRKVHPPEKTVTTLKENVEWAANQMK